MSHNACAPRPCRIAFIAETFGPQALPALIDGLAASGMAIAIFDPADRLVFSCPAFREAFDVQPGEQTFSTIVRHCHAVRRGPVIGTEDAETWLAEANEKRRSAPQRRFEVDLADGRWMWATETTYNDGWLMLALHDFTPLKMRQMVLESARDAAQQAADTDPLTGLANRRAVMRYLEDCVEAAGPETPLTIALIDIDHFKRINDGHGHDAGDEVLRHFGRYCRHIFRNSDRIGRVGGEEFLLVLANTRQEAGVTALQRFRHHLRRANQLLPQELAFTFSVGSAEWRPGLTGGDLYRSADAALYRAKADGRDRIVTADMAHPPASRR